MSSNPEVSRQVCPDGTIVIHYQNGVRCVQYGDFFSSHVFSYYEPGQTHWHYCDVVNHVTGRNTRYYQTVESNAVSGEEPAPG